MVEVERSLECPACGSTLSQEGWSEGLCPGCILELALESPSLLDEIEGPDEDETLAFSAGVFSRGQILGNRYRVRSLLGRGGMGEIWRASDLKLRVDVALKALRQELLEKPRAVLGLGCWMSVGRTLAWPPQRATV